MTKPVLRGTEVVWPTSPKLKGAITVSREEMERALEGLRRPKKAPKG